MTTTTEARWSVTIVWSSGDADRTPRCQSVEDAVTDAGAYMIDVDDREPMAAVVTEVEPDGVPRSAEAFVRLPSGEWRDASGDVVRLFDTPPERPRWLATIVWTTAGFDALTAADSAESAVEKATTVMVVDSRVPAALVVAEVDRRGESIGSESFLRVPSRGVAGLDRGDGAVRCLSLRSLGGD